MKTNYNNSDEQIIQMLTPKVEVKPSADLRSRILKAAAEQEKTTKQTKHSRSRLTYWIGTAVSMAAVVAIAITLSHNSPVYAARKYFSGAIMAASDIKTIVMKLSVRTNPDEPIDYLHPSLDFIPATVKVIYGEPMLWSMEKKDGRNVLCNGDGYIYEWIGGEDGRVGWKRLDDGSVDSDLAAFLDPRLLLEAERRTAERNKGTKYQVIDSGELVVVMAMTTAQGDFSDSEYTLNTSLAEANTVRVYSFAKSTGELVQMRIDIMVDDKPITVIQSESIAYNESLTADDLSDKDLSQIEFPTIEITNSTNSPLAGITADEAAKIILKAMNEWNTEILNTAMHYFKGDLMKVVEERYRGLEVKAIEKAVKSGLYPGRFVKCKVVLPNGKKETLVLALRNDNKDKIWLVDGGL